MAKSNIPIEQIVLSSDNSQLLLKITPIYAEITANDIIVLLKNPSLPQYKIDVDGVNQAVLALTSLHDIDTDPNATIDPIAIANQLDAELEIIISDDEMIATAQITTGYGGKCITLNEMKDQCDQLGLNFGLCTKSILGLINVCKSAEPGKIFKIKIAQGVAAADGKDAQFKCLVDVNAYRNTKPKRLANGKVDMHDLGQSLTVEAGTLVMKKIPMVAGTPGKTIKGEVITPKQGKDIAYKVNKNVQIAEYNPLHLISTSYGIPIMKDGFIQIDDILLLPSVDNKSGNIIYDGTVVIAEDIHENMKVTASGNITVMGFIESAQVTSGGDLNVMNTIIGHQVNEGDDYSCKVKCGGNLHGSIAQYTNLNIAKDLILSDQLIHCKTKCKGSVLVHNEQQSKGSIIGGTTRCHKQVVTTEIGAPGGTKTHITLISSANTLEQDKNQCITQIQEMDKIINSFRVIERKTDSIQDPIARKKAKKDIFIKKQRCRSQSDQLQENLTFLKLKLTRYSEETQVTATHKIFSGTTVTMGNKVWEKDEDHGPTLIRSVNQNLNATVYQATSKH